MADLTISIDDLGELDARLVRYVAQLTDLRPFWPKVRTLFIDWMREQWDTEGRAGGEAWAPLTPRYAAWKATKRPGRPILYFDGDLRQAASRPQTSAFPQLLILTVDDPKTGWHQGERRAKGVPKRVIVPERLPPAWERDLERAVGDYEAEVRRREGL